MSAVTRFEIGFWILAFVCALAALAWLVNTLDALSARLAARRAARKPVPTEVTPAGEDAITWERGGSIDLDLCNILDQPRIWPVRTRVGQPGCRGIPCIWFADGSVSECAAHDPRVRDAWKQWESEMADDHDH